MNLRSATFFASLALIGAHLSLGCSDDEDDPSGSGASAGGGVGGASSGHGGTNDVPKAGSAGSSSAGTNQSDGGDGPAAPEAGAGGGGGAQGGDATGGVGGDDDGVAGGAGGAGGAAPEATLFLDPDPAKDTLLGAAGSDAVTLYFFGNDAPAHSQSEAISACTGSCVDTWPVFHASSVVTGVGLAADDFGEFVRADGLMQSTFKGWPLYSHVGDTVAGERTGDGVNQLWHAVEFPFYTITLRTTLIEGEAVMHLATAEGRTIYNFSDDLPATVSDDPISSCTSAGCRRLWPVVAPPLARAVSSVSGDFDAFLRADTQAIQLAYDGLPIYTYLDDLAPGDVNGLEKANWVVAAP